jgi:Putative transposase/Transposase zinc-binding domain
MAAEPCPARSGQERPRLEVADIFRAAGEAYRDRYVPTFEQRKVMAAIERCRTSALGGHLDVCTKCRLERPAYNSCRNRHCPKCQSLTQARWIDRRRERIVPTKYFHVVFTMPQELRTLARLNPDEMYTLLIEAAARTLLDFGRSRLHAQIGVTTVLHTWTRDLRFHPHVHCIVTGGGLDDGGRRWIPAQSRFLFSVTAMSKVFRGKLLDGLSDLHAKQTLDLGGPCAPLADPAAFAALKDALYQKDWVVYAKRPFGGPTQVFQYLGRYTHRVGLSNQRLVSFDGHDVCFRTKHGKTAIVEAVEFVRRFLLHVLPTGFVKIRHYGLVAAANATTRLEIARRLLLNHDQATAAAPSGPNLPVGWRDLLLALTGIDLLVCPACGGRSIERHPLPRGYPQPVSRTDTS